MRRIMTRIMVLASLALLIAAVPAQAVTTVVSEGLDTLDGNKGGSKVTALTKAEGGDGTSRAGLMLRISPSTVIVLAPDQDGVWHCYRLGTAGQGCEFLDTDDVLPRRSILVNPTTAVVLGGGGNGDCDDGGTPNDILFVLRRLGAPGATVEEVDGDGLNAGGLCFGTPASDPIRINNNTVLFNQPGADTNYPDSDCPSGLDTDDTVVVAKIGAGATTLREIEVGDKLGVYLSGAPASLPVRVSDGIAVIASPGEDSQFADDDGCDDDDDGLVVVKGLTGGASFAIFKEIGRLAANPYNRPVMINTSAVVVLGTGDNGTQQEQELENDDDESDDEIHVVRNLGGAPLVKTFDGFGFMRRPKMLSSTTAVAFEEDQSMALVGCCSFEEDLVRLNVHRIKGIGGVLPTLTTIPIPNGDAFHQHEHWDHSTGLAMSATKMLFAVTGPPQVYLLNDAPAPFLGGAGGSADDWAEVKLTKVNDTTAGYTRAKQGGTGVIKINRNGSLTNYPVTLQGEGNDGFCCDDGDSINQPASQPVAITPSRFVVAAGGSNNAFADQSYPDLNGHDDGFLVVETRTLPPTFKFVTVRNSCGAFGCMPLALGTASAPIVAILGVGDNGQFDGNGDESDEDDELNIVKGF